MNYTRTISSYALIPGLLLLAACSGGGHPEAEGNPDTPVTVRVATPSGNMPEAVMASGQVEAIQTAAISTRVMGTITRIYVKVGDKVNKGQVLATISSQDLSAKRAQVDARIAGAKADLENARKDYDRFTALYGRQSATASELDNATLRYNAAKSNLDASQQMRNEVDASLTYTRLVAPFAGIVTQKLADEGSMASPGTPLLMVEQTNLLQVSATVGESDISRIRTGDKAQVEIKSTGIHTEGILTQISESSAATGGQYLVKISIPSKSQKDLYSGMYVNVWVPVKNKGDASNASQVPDSGNGAILIPVSALVRNDQLTGIYTISSAHTALLRWVRTGKTVGDRIEILSGLGQDEPFILHANGKLYNGVPIRQQ